MTQYLTFEGHVEAVAWGKATYTTLRLPQDVANYLLAAGAKRVEGEIAEHQINAALARAPVVEGIYIWAGKSLLDRIGIAVGERVEVRLRPVLTDAVDTPADLVGDLQHPDLICVWESLPPGKRRGMIYQIDTAKTSATRAKRISALVDTLKAAV